MTTTAGALAADLRRVANHLDRAPDAIIQAPYVSFLHYGTDAKETFAILARLLPKPTEITHDGSEVVLSGPFSSCRLSATIPASLICTVVEPAKPAVYRYDCELPADANEEV